MTEDPRSYHFALYAEPTSAGLLPPDAEDVANAIAEAISGCLPQLGLSGWRLAPLRPLPLTGAINEVAAPDESAVENRKWAVDRAKGLPLHGTYPAEVRARSVVKAAAVLEEYITQGDHDD